MPRTKKTGTEKKKRDYRESRIQSASVARLSLLGVYVLMIPNGECGKMTVRKFLRLVAMGFRAGAWDTLLLERGTNRFFGLEFKAPGGKQSDSQTAFEAVCRANNWPYKIAESVEEAEEAARGWGLCR